VWYHFPSSLVSSTWTRIGSFVCCITTVSPHWRLFFGPGQCSKSVLFFILWTRISPSALPIATIFTRNLHSTKSIQRISDVLVFDAMSLSLSYHCGHSINPSPRPFQMVPSELPHGVSRANLHSSFLFHGSYLNDLEERGCHQVEVYQYISVLICSFTKFSSWFCSSPPSVKGCTRTPSR
jgi:hypothetical protein